MLRLLPALTAFSVVGLGLSGLWLSWPMLEVVAAYKAKILCSGVFVSGRDPQKVAEEDLSVDNLAGLRFFPHAVDLTNQEVTVSVPGIISRRAVFRPGLGCTLLIDGGTSRLPVETAVSGRAPSSLQSALWSQGDQVNPYSAPLGIDGKRLAAAMDHAFAEPNPAALQRTRAVVVVHRGRIVAERYAPGFDEATAQLGWSMSKSALNALVGALVHRDPDQWGLNRTNLLPEWAGDARAKISLEHLLQMRSGLAFSEAYEDYTSDVIKMLFRATNAGAFAASKPLAGDPGSGWQYSSGSSNIISYVLRRQSPNMADYLTLPERMLFQPLGMRNALIETDATGTFTASSFMYATPRDWARLGLLYLQDGMWNGKRLLPEHWVLQSVTPVPWAPNGQYGMHVWLKLPDEPNGGEPPLPDDAFYMLGHAGQIVAVIPTRELVIVRMGLALAPGAWRPASILSKFVDAFPAR